MLAYLYVFASLLWLRPIKSHNCKIGIIDVADDAYGFGLAKCEPTQRVITRNGQVYVNSNDGGENHKYGQHAGPHWLVQAIKASDQYTEDIHRADVLFVDDYCFMMSHTGSFHGGSFTDGFDPKAELDKAYNKLVSWPRFMRMNGSDFVFYSPHPLTGLSQTDLRCTAFGRSLHIVVDASQRRDCPMPAKQNYVIVPYASPHFVEDQGAWPVRTRLLYFIGGCAEEGSHGKRMRRLLVKLMQQHAMFHPSDDLFVHCNGEENLPTQAHRDVRHSMRRSLFCIVLPGDTASSRRLTETVLAGCIPVFIGPPWSSMPLSDKIDYPQIALFFQLDDFQELMQESLQALPDQKSDDTVADVFDIRGWSPDTDISSHIVQVGNVSDMLGLLRSMDNYKIKELQQSGVMTSSFFRYQHLDAESESHSAPTVPDVVMDLLCQRIMETNVTET